MIMKKYLLKFAFSAILLALMACEKPVMDEIVVISTPYGPRYFMTIPHYTKQTF
jgi:hypothetical protein